MSSNIIFCNGYRGCNNPNHPLHRRPRPNNAAPAPSNNPAPPNAPRIPRQVGIRSGHILSSSILKVGGKKPWVEGEKKKPDLVVFDSDSDDNVESDSDDNNNNNNIIVEENN